jgi:hypothetical protein
MGEEETIVTSNTRSSGIERGHRHLRSLGAPPSIHNGGGAGRTGNYVLRSGLGRQQARPPTPQGTPTMPTPTPTPMPTPFVVVVADDKRPARRPPRCLPARWVRRWRSRAESPRRHGSSQSGARRLWTRRHPRGARCTCKHAHTHTHTRTNDGGRRRRRPRRTTNRLGRREGWTGDDDALFQLFWIRPHVRLDKAAVVWWRRCEHHHSRPAQKRWELRRNSELHRVGGVGCAALLLLLLLPPSVLGVGRRHLLECAVAVATTILHAQHDGAVLARDQVPEFEERHGLHSHHRRSHHRAGRLRLGGRRCWCGCYCCHANHRNQHRGP